MTRSIFQKHICYDSVFPDGTVFVLYRWSEIVSDLGETERLLFNLDLTVPKEAIEVICWKYNLWYVNGCLWAFSNNQDRLIKGCLELVERAYGLRKRSESNS